MSKTNILSFLLDLIEAEVYIVRTVKKDFKCKRCKVRKKNCLVKINESGFKKTMYICKSCFGYKYDYRSFKDDPIKIKRLSEDPKPHLPWK